MKKQFVRGFTLMEMAFVLTLFGLLVGGVLRGQELINSARARNIIDQRLSIQTALTGFTTRYKAMPGDLTVAQRNFIGSGVIASASIPGNGIIELPAGGVANESVLFFQNLAATSFLSCASCMSVNGNAVSTNQNSPVNVSGAHLLFGTVAGSALGDSWLDRGAPLLGARNVLITGGALTGEILREIDIKADDGAPHTGLFRQSTTGGADPTATCAPAAGVQNTWANNGQSNCAGAWLF